jgi:hypothetical protein
MTGSEETAENRGQRTILFEIFFSPRVEAVFPLRKGNMYSDPDFPVIIYCPGILACT